MQDTPFPLEIHRAAKDLFDKRGAGAVVFSEGNYQVEVLDPREKQTYWPFLQIDDRGTLLDSLCECTQAEKQGFCIHIAAGWLKIFGDKKEPLHVRFRRSLWNELCQIAGRRHGYETKSLKKSKPQAKKAGYQAFSTTGKLLFFIETKNERGLERLKELIEKRLVETEETSLKFSNLPPEELSLWRQGKATFFLRYELSFWSDLAKWWMLLQEEKEPYQITFDQSSLSLPKWIHGDFADCRFGFYIAEASWPKIIPTLSSVNSPLKTYELSGKQIEKITYDPEKKTFELHFLPLPPQPLKKAPSGAASYKVGGWLYVSADGFYPERTDPLLEQSLIKEEKIALFLQRHCFLIEKYLVGASIHLSDVKVRYDLFFDEEQRLQIHTYIFDKGDLQMAGSGYFGSWVYLENKGFYRLEEQLFEGKVLFIPKEKVSDFISRHRHWLQGFEGFETHLSSLESYLTFTLGSDEVLQFGTRHALMDETEGAVDIGDWLYLKGKGFYAKASSRLSGFLKSGTRVPRQDISRFIRQYREELEGIKGFFSAKTPLQKTGLKISLNDRGQISVRPQFFYAPSYEATAVHIFGDFTYVSKEGFCEIPNDLKLPEQFAKEQLIDPLSEPYFVSQELPSLLPFVLEMDSRLCVPKELFLRILKVKRDLASKTGGWLVDLAYESDLGRMTAFAIWEGQQQLKRYLFSDIGLLFLRTSRFNWLKNLPKRRWRKKGKQLRLTTLEWIRLSVFEEIREPAGNSADEVLARELLEGFRQFQTHELIDLSGLQSSLRPYQEVGLRWLWFLYCMGLSGLLCDEMGLGKTHQAMALLAAVKNSPQEKRPSSLVVCPTSVIYHWQEQLLRFLPHLKVHTFYGAARTLSQESCDLILTSYGTLRSEKETLAKIPFELAIFDEIQIAKNAHSQTHKALKGLDAKMRLGLTGTPIENRLLELKALLDLAVPGYLPNDAAFKEFFSSPIEKGQDSEKKALLSKLIHPFILRRKKAEVLMDLPEKTEEIAYCELSAEQKGLYQDIFFSAKDKMFKELRDESKPVPYVHIFSLLTKLKQVCDHPCLITKKIDEYAKHASGKWDLFVELLQEARDSKQKLVVFSQYLDMLDIIEKYLTDNKIGFAGIRGSTRNRKEQLEAFRSDPS
ncbi:MAG: DEAD/DEAH box helicase, partial [Anaerolineae bacterium]